MVKKCLDMLLTAVLTGQKNYWHIIIEERHKTPTVQGHPHQKQKTKLVINQNASELGQDYVESEYMEYLPSMSTDHTHSDIL